VRPTRLSILLTIALATSGAGPARAQTTGLTPITDLGAGSYAGFPGGLYPGGANTPPSGHAAAALSRAGLIVPRDAGGNASPAGWIGMIAVGMSNTTHEFGAFERNADADPNRNARVVILDTGFGGQTATIIADPAAAYWTTMSQRIAAMGLTPAQVQVAWLKEAEAGPPNDFPVHAQALRDTLKKVVNNLHDKFPNLAICYVSSRIYGGYSAQGGLNPEPQAYESGFSVKWLIEDQIGGDPQLNYGQLAGTVEAPLLLWGPYLWADGTNPRSDGLTWQIGDLESDRVHPSAAGEQKVAGMLQSFFASEPSAAPWWPLQPDAHLEVVDAVHDAYVSAAAPTANFGSDPRLLAQGGPSPLLSYARFDLTGVTRPILMSKLSLRVTTDGGAGGAIRRVDDASWNEATVTYATAPPLVSTLVTLPPSTRDGTIGGNVTTIAQIDPDGQVSFALTSSAAQPAFHHSKEGGHPPRLVMAVSNGVAGVGEARPAGPAIRLLGANPSATGARARVLLPASGAFEADVLSIDGRRVRGLARGARPAGEHEILWDGADARGRRVPAGLYWIRVRSGRASAIARVVILK
jgi:hypothetical protein